MKSVSYRLDGICQENESFVSGRMFPDIFDLFRLENLLGRLGVLNLVQGYWAMASIAGIYWKIKIDGIINKSVT